MSEMTMGQRIAEQRKKLGLSQEALGEKVGVSRQAISKWESDGAVPEIDKLIALSKLFRVSVGWLLGVEEQEAQKPDELSEEQLKMVEEIVRRYQPQPEPMEKKFPWIISIGLFAAALAIVVWMFFSIGSGNRDYSRQISALNSGYQSIQSQLSELSGRVEDIASAAESAEELLLSYEFQLEEVTEGGQMVDDNPRDNILVVDMPTAEITFTAVPKQHTDSNAAWLAVLLNGQQVQQVECLWQGTGYTAELSLWLADGYEYRFVLEHQDGTQEIQELDGYDYSDLANSTSLRCDLLDPVEVSYSFDSWTLEILNCYVRAFKPVLGDGADARWSEAGVILYHNGKELDRNILPVDWDTGRDVVVRDYRDSAASLRSVKLEEGDELELTCYMALNDGLNAEVTIGCWTVRDGEFIELDKEE